jgi:hypothetical protein
MERSGMSQINEVVMLQCACGCEFERGQDLVDKYKEYKNEYPSAARFYKRKIASCDKCLHEKMQNSLRALPDILKALAT